MTDEQMAEIYGVSVELYRQWIANKASIRVEDLELRLKSVRIAVRAWILNRPDGTSCRIRHFCHDKTYRAAYARYLLSTRATIRRLKSIRKD